MRHVGPRSPLNPGRLAAGRTLLAVERGAHAEDMLAELAPEDDADRRLAWHLVLGVLRRQGALDTLLEQVAGRPMARVDAAARIALRIGLFEATLARTPLHAAVDQAVELCRRCDAPRATGFVNAVLRKAAERPLPEDPALDLPPWLRERWLPAMAAWVGKLDQPPPLCGTWRNPEAPVPELQTRPVRAAGVEVPGAFAVVDPRGPVTELPGFAQGAWWVMDPAAAAVADLGLPLGLPAGSRVLDACAAPGGKSLRLASRGAQVVAVDLEPHRLAQVAEGGARTGLSLQIRVHDWLQGPLPDVGAEFDLVLVDAPCTGLGTVRRHPEIRWRRQPTDPAAMALRQRQILQAASTHLAPGGRLVYAVCSPMPEEGTGVVQTLSGFSIHQAWASVPPTDDEDAFQAFVLQRAGRPATQ